MALPFAVLLGFVLALLVPLIRHVLGRYAVVAFVAAPVLLVALFINLAPGVLDGEPVRWSTEWVPQLELAFSFSLDGLSLLFCLLITGVGVAVILYAEHYLHGHAEIDRFHALALAFMGSMLGLVLADNLLTLFVFWELTTITSYLLIGFYFKRETAIFANLKAFVVNRVGDSDRASALSSLTMFFEVGSVAGGLLIGAFAEVVGKQLGFLGGVMFCVLGLYLLRFRLVPAGSPDAGPTHRLSSASYTPVAGD